MPSAGLFLWSGPACFHCGPNPAARAKDTLDHCPLWLGRADHVFQNLIDDILLEDTKIAVVQQILLERFQFQAKLGRHVTNLQQAKVGQAGLRAHRRKLRHVNEDFISGKLVRPGIDLWENVVQSGFSVVFGVTCTMCHWFYCNNRFSTVSAGPASNMEERPYIAVACLVLQPGILGGLCTPGETRLVILKKFPDGKAKPK